MLSKHDIFLAASKIKLLVCDVDGVLTNGLITYDSNGIETKQFHVHDGQGIKLLQKAGIDIAIITKRNSSMVTKRMEELGIKYVYQNSSNKLTDFNKIKTQLNLENNQIAYMGDDVPDLCVMKEVGLAICPNDAPLIRFPMAKDHIHWQTHKNGGLGAVREVCELILLSQDKFML